MAELTAQELQDVYNAMVKPIGHPDPVGFMARALLRSGGDPDYIGVDGTMGFLPLDADRALAELGALDVQSLEGNIGAALAADVQNLEKAGTLRGMMILTHDGDENPSPETQAMLDDLDAAKVEMKEILFPRLATVEDVIMVLKARKTPTKTRMNFFEGLLNGRT